MTDTNPTLSHLRYELQKAEAALINSIDLFKKREELEIFEIELQKKINEENAKQFPSKHVNEADEKSLKLLKKKKQEIDRSLDSIGEDIHEQIEAQRAELLTAIFQSYPDQKLYYTKMLDDLETVDQDLQKLSAANILCANLETSLLQIVTIRQEIRRKGILSYIFGTNPNVAITQHLKFIELEIKETMPSFEQHEAFKELTSYLISLHEQSKTRWGFRKIDAMVENALKENRKNQEILKDQESRKQIQKQRIITSIESWLMNF